MADVPNPKLKLTAVDEVSPVLGKISEKVKALALELGPELLAVAGIASIGALFEKSIEKADEAQRQTQLLANALRNLGPAAQSSLPALEELTKTLAIKTGINREEITQTLTYLVQKTGDYQKATAALPAVLDQATASHKGLTAAARAAVQALDGNAAGMKRLGVTVHDGETAWQAYVRTAKGAAEAAATPLSKDKEALDAVILSLGQLLTQNTLWGKGNDLIASTLLTVSNWLDKAHEKFIAIVNFVRPAWKAMLDLIVNIGSVVLDVVETVGPPLLGLAGKLLTVLTFLFKLFDEGVIRTVEGIKLIQRGWEYGLSLMLSATSDFVQSVDKLLNKVGVHVLDGVADTMRTMSAKLAKDAIDNMHLIIAAADEAHKKIWEPPEQIKTSIPKLAKSTIGSSPDLGVANPQADKDELELLKQELEWSDKRAEALARLNQMEVAQKAIVNDTTKSLDARAKAATELGKIESILDADSQRAFNTEVEQDKLWLQNGSTKEKAVRDLTALQASLNAQLKNVNLTLNEQLKIKKQLDTVDQLLKKNEPEWLKIKTQLDQMAHSFQDVNEVLKDMAYGTVADLQSGLAKAGDEMGKGKDVWKANAQAAKDAVKESSEAIGKQLIGMGLGKLAEGLWPPNPVAIASGVGLIAAGELLSAAGSAVGGSSGGGSSNSAHVGKNQSQLSGGRGNVNINFPGGQIFNPYDPKQRYAFQDFANTLTGQNVSVNFGQSN